MRKHSEGFKEALRGMRELNGIVSYIGPGGARILTTEIDDNLDTEDLFDIGTETGEVEIDGESIYRINPIGQVNLFKTVCKSVEVESSISIPVGELINVQIGVMVDDEYEYMNFGDYRVIQEPTYQADTNTYVIQGFDKMVEAMIKYDEDPLEIEYPIKHKDLLETIFKKFNWNYILPEYDVQDELVQDLYSNRDMTYRDILDDLCVATGGNLMFNEKSVLELKYITDTEQVIDDEDLKDSNVNLGEVYGPVNEVIYTDDDDIEYVIGRDDKSVEENGRITLNLGTNLFIGSDEEGLMFKRIFEKIKGLKFNLFDVDTIGLLIYNLLDKFKIKHKDKEYDVVLMNDDVKLTQGLVETCYCEEPEGNKEIYTSGLNEDEQKIKNATIKVDKAMASIVLKIDSDGNIASVELGEDADKGTKVDIKADNINFESYTFNLSTSDLTIDSDNIRIDNEGIWLKNGSVIADRNGLMTLLQFNGCSYSSTMIGVPGYAPLGYSYGYDYTLGRTVFFKDKMFFDVYIPEGFIVKEAYVHLYHEPINWHDQAGDASNAYSRNLRLYKADQNTLVNQKLTINKETYNIVEDNLTYSEITGAFGASGFTGSASQATGTTSIDISSSIDTGRNRLAIYTANAVVSSTAQQMAQTGACYATLEVIGFKPYTTTV